MRDLASFIGGVLTCALFMWVFASLNPPLRPPPLKVETSSTTTEKQRPPAVQGEWRWSPLGACAPGTEARQHLTITPSASELAVGRLAPWTLRQAVETFRACGVVALTPGMQLVGHPAAAAVAAAEEAVASGGRRTKARSSSSSSNGQQQRESGSLAEVEAALDASLSPLLASRKRVRSKLRHAMANHQSLRELWHSPGECVMETSASFVKRKRPAQRIRGWCVWQEYCKVMAGKAIYGQGPK
jgi:hypothetical protein